MGNEEIIITIMSFAIIIIIFVVSFSKGKMILKVKTKLFEIIIKKETDKE